MSFCFPFLLCVMVALSCSRGHADNNEATAVDSVELVVDSQRVDTPRIVTIAFVGDVMMGTTFPDSTDGSNLPAAEGRHLFDHVKRIIARADFAGLNLEGTLLDGPGKRREMRNPDTYYIFRQPTAYVQNLIDAGFDFAGIANNHINDFGEPGRRSTINTLRAAELAHAGLRGSCETAFVERNGTVFGIAQVGHGGNNVDVNDLNEVRRVVKALRDSADIVIFSMHAGAEGKDKSHVPHEVETFVGERRGNVEAVAHAAIDAGADVVFGHGPHVVRAIELYKDHIIFYSLGNFCTPYRVSITGISGQAPIAEVELNADGTFAGGRIHSFIQRKGGGPVPDPSNAAVRQIRTLSEADFPASPLLIADDGVITKK